MYLLLFKIEVSCIEKRFCKFIGVQKYEVKE